MSDMLENSKHISFYNNGIVKLLDINKELEIVKKQNLLSAFNDSEIYVYGLGSVEINSSKEDNRDSDVLDRLADFWDEYFMSSNAKPRGLRSYNMDYNLEYWFINVRWKHAGPIKESVTPSEGKTRV